MRLAEKKRFTYKSAYLYEQIRKMHEQQEEYLVVVKYDVKSFVDLVHLKFRLQQLDEELCKVQKEMYRDRASLKRSCKNANELEFFETSEGDYREWLEQIKLQKKDNLKNLKVVEWCLERDGSMLDAEMEYRISVDDMVDLEEIEKDEPDLRKGDIPKYEEAKSASNKADYMRMSVAEKVRCYPFDEKRTEQIIETMGLLGINCREDSRVSGECVS